MVSTLQKIKSLFKPASADPKAQPVDEYSQSLEQLCEQARNLCPDTWLANKIVTSKSGQSFAHPYDAFPAESLPYVRAARTILGDSIPQSVAARFDAPMAPK
jgi:hypothetical protein